MLAYDYENILSVVPEAYPLIKEASVTEDYPLDSQASTLASALRIQYLTKVAHESIPASVEWEVSKAVSAFGLMEKVAQYSARMDAFAKDKAIFDSYDEEQTLRIKEASAFVQAEVLRPDLEKIASTCSDIVSSFEGTSLSFSEDTLRYSGSYMLDKQATELCLRARSHLTKCAEYEAILGLVQGGFPVEKLNEMSREKRAAFATAVVKLDKANAYPGDFYKEAFVKQAELSVDLGGKSYPMSKITALGNGYLGDILGKDVASSLTGDQGDDKAILDSLPLDSKTALARFIK